MNTKFASGLHLTDQSREQLKLLLYALASALLPFAGAALLILIGHAD